MIKTKNPKSRLNKKVKLFLLIIIFTAMLDLLSTSWALSLSNINFEANPLIHLLGGNIWVAIIIKILAVLLIILVVKSNFAKPSFNSHFFITGFMLVAIILQIFAGFENFNYAFKLQNLYKQSEAVRTNQLTGDIMFIPDLDNPDKTITSSPLSPKARSLAYLFFVTVFGLWPVFFAYINLRVTQWIQK